MVNNDAIQHLGKDILIKKEGQDEVIPLTYTMVRVSGITPSMLYFLVHGDGIFLGEDKFVRVYEKPNLTA